MVKLPRIPDAPPLGESRNQAIQQNRQNERSLRRKKRLQDFNTVLQEYIAPC